MPRLQFGKWEGYDIRDVDREYLEWLKEHSERTINMVTEELERRDNDAEASMSWMERIIAAGYRELSKKHHPDRGGDPEEMKELNASHDLLKEALGTKGSARWDDVA